MKSLWLKSTIISIHFFTPNFFAKKEIKQELLWVNPNIVILLSSQIFLQKNIRKKLKSLWLKSTTISIPSPAPNFFARKPKRKKREPLRRRIRHINLSLWSEISRQVSRLSPKTLVLAKEQFRDAFAVGALRGPKGTGEKKQDIWGIHGL